MSLALVRFRQGQQWAWGCVSGDKVHAPQSWRGMSTGAIVGRGVDLLRRELHDPIVGVHALIDLDLLAPVTAHQQLIFQVGNYRSHLQEVGVRNFQQAPNAYFSKASSALAPPTGCVTRPPGVRLLDYEVELGLIIGQPMYATTQVKAQALGAYVAGLVMVNDISARDPQIADGQYFHSKSHRGFCPVGPLLILLDRGDWQLLNQLRLRLWVNGKLRQDALLSDMVHPPHTSLSRLTQAINLHPGDLLATGTPGGCAIRAPSVGLQKLMNLLPDRIKFKGFVNAQARSGRYLKDGDVMTCHIGTSDGRIDLGRQSVEVVA
jgi:2,4-didehydro-3-deoxy-L-rhamnonate hydrolase